jgi:hypothetical protein
VIPIRYNNYSGRQIVVGAVLGLVVGLIVYYTSSSADVMSYRSDHASKLGGGVAIAVAGLMDVVERAINGIRRGHGASAAFGSSSGGHIWYVPMWMISAGVTFLILR